MEFIKGCFFGDTLHIVPFDFRNRRNLIRNIYYIIWVISVMQYIFMPPCVCIDISDIHLYTCSLMVYGIGLVVSLSILLDNISEMYMMKYKNQTIIKLAR